MAFVEEEIQDETLLDWFNRFTCDEGRLIARVPVGKFVEEQINNERRIFIEVYKLSDGFLLWNEWEFTLEYAATAEEAQQLIEQIQDSWIVLAGNFQGASIQVRPLSLSEPPANY
jgi:hypothetical protein